MNDPRTKLANDVAAFLAKGGTIKILPAFRSSPNQDSPLSRNRPRSRPPVQSTLTEPAVRQIRKDKRIASAVAKDHGVSPDLIRKIRARTRWGHVE